MVLVLPIVMALANKGYGLALLLIVIASVTDALDGFLARRFDWTSRLGSILDPLADKLLLMATYPILGWFGHIPIWLVALVLFRDVIIISGATIYHYRVGVFELDPTLISKINTVFQIVLAIAVIADLYGISLPITVIDLLIGIVLFTTMASGTHYIWHWSSFAVAQQK